MQKDDLNVYLSLSVQFTMIIRKRNALLGLNTVSYVTHFRNHQSTNASEPFLAIEISPSQGEINIFRSIVDVNLIFSPTLYLMTDH